MRPAMWLMLAVSLFLCSNTGAQDYLGCFARASLPLNQEDNEASDGIHHTRVYSKCRESCGHQNKVVFGIKRNGAKGTNAECLCGDEVPTDSASSCSRQCDGVACGGNYGKISVYSMCDSKNSYGVSCDQSCFCRNNLPCRYEDGFCPNGCDVNYYGPSCDKSGAADGYEHVGCFDVTGTDQGTRSPATAAVDCRQTCKTKQQTYFGLKRNEDAMVQCYCADSLPKLGDRLDSCDQTCGDSPCGGSTTVDYYTVCPVGYYGQTECNTRCADCQIRSWVCKFGKNAASCVWCDLGTESRLCDVDECADAGVCGTAVCVNTPGSYSCTCDDGFLLDNPGLSCTDIDECQQASSNPCGEMRCQNVEGSHECEICPQGEQVIQNEWTRCEDIDECQASINPCEEMRCHNSAGTFMCEPCPDGHRVIQNEWNHCEDECLAKTAGCNQTCTNIIGSYNCSCMDGYRLGPNEFDCFDIDECNLDLMICEQQCLNTDGSFICQCVDGYILNNTHCIDVDECTQNNGGCEAICDNTPGGYRCFCEEGFILTEGTMCEKSNNDVLMVTVPVVISAVIVVIAAVLAVIFVCRKWSASRASAAPDIACDSQNIQSPRSAGAPDIACDSQNIQSPRSDVAKTSLQEVTVEYEEIPDIQNSRNPYQGLDKQDVQSTSANETTYETIPHTYYN